MSKFDEALKSATRDILRGYKRIIKGTMEVAVLIDKLPPEKHAKYLRRIQKKLLPLMNKMEELGAIKKSEDDLPF